MTTGTLPDHEQRDQGRPLQPGTRRRQALTWAVCALIPLSIVAALVVLLQMTSDAAAATGGCGGG